MPFAALAALATGSLLLQGCYDTLPLRQDVPPIPARVQVILNDQGRAALSDRLGTAVDRIEGDCVAVQDDEYVVMTYRVMQLNGNSATWNGERVHIAKRYASGFQLRRLNATKTSLAAAGVVGGITAFILGTSLISGGGSDPTPTTPEPNPSLRLGSVRR